MNAFNSNFEGTNPFSRNARKSKNQKNLKETDSEYIREVSRKNSELLKKIDLIYQSFKKSSNDKLKVRTFDKCNEKLQEMFENTRNLEINIEEVYFDDRKKIVEDIKSAKEVLEKLK